MKYELLLQGPSAEIPFDPARVEGAWASRTVLLRTDGARVWRLPSGDVELSPVVEGGVLKALALRATLSERTDHLRELVPEAARLAEQAQATLFDPQLCRTVGAHDVESVEAEFRRLARYAGAMVGVSEAVGASFPQEQHEGPSAGVKVLLALAAFFGALWLALRL